MFSASGRSFEAVWIGAEGIVSNRSNSV